MTVTQIVSARLRVATAGAMLSLIAISRCQAAAADDPPDSSSKANRHAETRSLQSEASSLKSEVSNLRSDIFSGQTGIAAALLGSLSLEHMKNLGQMLDQDWKPRPEWGDMVVAILKGERMRPGMGWWRPSSKRYDWNWLREHFDSNGDGRIERKELPTDLPQADLYFERLDRDLDGEITAADFEGSTPQPMSMAAMQNMMTNYLFYLLDKDSNGRISQDELAAFFVQADRGSFGYLTPEDLRLALEDPDARKPRTAGQDDEPPAGEMLKMLFSGQLGALEEGPRLGEEAPDFTLSTHDAQSSVRLSASRGKPVVLIFGSFT